MTHILSPEDVLRIRARYSKRSRKRANEPANASQAIPAKPAKPANLVKPVKRGRPSKPRIINRCWHWCPIGRHDWQHPIKSTESTIDNWREVCPLHKHINKRTSTKKIKI